MRLRFYERVNVFRRWYSAISAVAVMIFGMTSGPLAAQIYARARVEGGIIEGRLSESVLSFKGIPYAAPPVRNYRWRAPRRVVPWQGVRDASEFGHDCAQNPDPIDTAPARTTPAEDCLVLNVWRPAAEAPGTNLPVLVWIHGGAFVNGGSSRAIYDGTEFARRGIIFVSINYRLGRFGFFSHPALIAAGEGPVGNFAYMDQIRALGWVKRNIGAFGGNPKKVTVMGESAGGFSVLGLLTSPKATDLFDRAIVLSGGGRSFLLGGKAINGGTSTDLSADQMGVNFARSAGIEDSGPEVLKELRALSTDVVLGTLNMSGESPADSQTYCGGPIVDNSIVIAPPQIMLRRGEFSKVPVIIGTTTHDLSIIPPQYLDNPFSYFGAKAPIAKAIYDRDDKPGLTKASAVLGADIAMQEPARFVAKTLIRNGVPVWLYRFDYVAESARAGQEGASHASELPYVFNTLDFRYGAAVREKDKMTAKQLMSYFVNFVKSGQPNGPTLPIWPRFEPIQSELMIFTRDSGAVAQQDPWKDRLDLVEQVADRP
jgi:para-nitrobenzyl esterase